MTNVVLICTDQWRGDCLSHLGHPQVRTPNLDALASRGVTHTRAYSPAPTCVPARMSLFTGLEPATHGRVGYQDGVDFDFDTTLAGCFTKAGFQTQAIGKMHVSPARYRAGFENVILHDGYLHHGRKGRPDVRFNDDYAVWLRRQPNVDAFADEFEDAVHCNEVAARPWTRPEYQHPTNWITTEAIEWLYRRDPTKPFFLYLSYHRPHAPYNPPRWAFDIYNSQEISLPPRGNWETQLLTQWRHDWDPQSLVADFSDQVVHEALAGYWGNITHIDAQLERFFEALTDFSLAEDTIICFTSDHGDMMGDHGMWRKGFPYEGSSRIPLIIAGPSIGNGKRDTLFSLTDIMPTLLDLVGVEIPASLDGTSHAQALRSLKQADAPRSKVTAPVAKTNGESDGSSPMLHGEHAIFAQSLQWVITDEYKYVWWSSDGTEQLFHLASDPHELNDLLRVPEISCEPAQASEDRLVAEQAQALRRCRAFLISKLIGREEGFVRNGELVPGRQVKPVLSGH